MALQFQNVSINFAGGEDSKSNEKLIPPTKLERAVNVRQKNEDTIELRNGYDNLGNTVQESSSTSSLTAGEALNVYNDELLLFNDNKLYSRLEFNDRWVSKGSVVPVVADTQSIVKNNYSQTKGDFDTINGLSVYAWQDTRSSGSVYASVIDQATGNVVVAETLLASGASNPKVRAVGSFIFVFFVNTSTSAIQYRKFDPSSPLSFGSATNIISGLDPLYLYDVAKSADAICFAAYKTGTTVDVGYMDQYGAIPASGRAATVNFVQAVENHLSVHIDPSNLDVYVIYSRSAGGTLANVYSVNLGAPIASAVTLSSSRSFNSTCAFSTSNSADVILELRNPLEGQSFLPAAVFPATDQISIANHGFEGGEQVQISSTTTIPPGLSANTTYYVIKIDNTFFQLATSQNNVVNGVPVDITGAGAGTHTVSALFAPTQRTLYKLNLTRTGTVSGGANLKFHLELASKAFEYNGTWYFFAVYDTDLQGTYFCLDTSGNVIARLYAGLSGSRSDAYIPQIVETSTGTFSGAFPYRNNSFSENNRIIAQTGIAKIALDFSSSDRYFADQLGSTLYVGGGFVSNYDGVSVVESGFHMYPERLRATSGNTIGGSMSAGNYQYCFVYAWTDNNGNIHRSAPSVPLNINLTLAGSTCQIAFRVSKVQLTAKTSTRSDIVVEGYRTTNNGSVFRKFTSTTVPNVADPLLSEVVVSDTVSDTSLLSGELLYTTGNVLENEAPPAAKYVAATKNRVILYGTENPDVIVYSKELSSGYGLGFSSFFTKPVDREGGKPKGVIAMDDKIIIFKERRIYYLAGDGPTDLGTEDTFIRPELIASDTGLQDSNSLVLTDFGVMFKSNKGIYLLDRSLNLSYIGADVEEYNSYTVTSADLLTDLNEVVFLTNGPALVFNYFTKQWYRWTNHDGRDAVTWKNKYNYLRTNGGYVYQENRDKFLDDNSFIEMDVTTAWIKVAGIQDFQRIRRNSVVGEFFSEHTLQQEVGYDYNDAFPVIQTWDPSDVIQSGVWGDGATWGSDSVWGAIVDGVYQVRFHMPVQKCEAVRFRWKNLPRGTSTGKQLSLSNLTLEVGTKMGINKMREGKTR